jgi:hypothetical protein
MVCRAPTPSAGSCIGGSNTGQQLSYDAPGRLSAWQNVPGANPAASASERYDGEVARVAHTAQGRKCRSSSRRPRTCQVTLSK